MRAIRLLLGLVVLLAVTACGGAARTEPGPAGSGSTGITGIALAGPTCPVEQPGDPACAARPVSGARVVVRDATGADLAAAVTDATGAFFVAVPPGTYTVVAQHAEGFMAEPTPVTVEVTTGVERIELSYDTGIR